MPPSYEKTAQEIAEVKAHEQHQLHRLVLSSRASHQALASGDWSDPSTWKDGRVPKAGAEVWIPTGARVEVTRDHGSAALDWILVDGELAFAPDRTTALKVVTLVISESGRFQIGSADQRVAVGKRARLIFADRGERDSHRDPMDLSGGLLASGRVELYGATKTAWVLPQGGLTKGVREVSVGDFPEGWQAGDEVLIPGTAPDGEQDEVLTLSRVSAKQGRLRFDRPLEFDHPAPQGVQVPIGNLTRNIVISSESYRDISRRGHVMFMHQQTGVVIDGVAFRNLGRTDTRIAHTFPRLDGREKLVPGTDANTIARYAVHFHVRAGADREVDPHIFRRSVIVDSPKHGLVNHGGHVLAQENVTYRVDGSHFFGENGSEIGTFEGNLAVRSGGSPEGYKGFGLKSRMYMFDFGHGGHGFWTQGAGIVMKGNYAFGHQGAGFSIYSIPMEEGGGKVEFQAANLGREMRSRGAKALDIRNVPFEFYGNYAAASHAGLEIWRHQRYLEPQPDRVSRVEDSTFWGVRGDAVVLTYSRNIAFRNVRLYGNPQRLEAKGFGGVNSTTGSLTFDNVHVEGFRIGIDLPTRGDNAVRNSYLNNHRNIRVRLLRNRGFDATLENLEFGTLDVPRQFDIFMEGWSAESGETPHRADLSGLFERARVIVKGTKPGLDGKQIYFREQAWNAFPYNGLGVPELEGKSSHYVWHNQQVAFGGSQAPKGARVKHRIWGLVGEPADTEPMLQLESLRFANVLDGYVPVVRNQEDQFLQAPPVDLKEGWNFLRVPTESQDRTVLVYGDTTPPRWEMHPLFPTQVHPDDLQFGIRVTGRAVDQVAGLETSITHAPFVREFERTEDGRATFSVSFHDGADNWGKIPVYLEVTEKAIRRGPFVAHYVQNFQPPEKLEPRKVAALSP
ncbi:MAG: G8 domain-containing protein [Deltaproteobacteria bacterium]|nr:G8 domain-containing protein [Deltaproteobacteria bacterium]